MQAKAPWLECALDGAKLLHTVPVLALPHTEGAPIYIGRLQVCKPIFKAARASPPPLHIALPRSAFEPCITGVDGYEAGMRVHLAGYRCREKGNRMPRALLLQVVRAGVPPRSHGRATLTAVGANRPTSRSVPHAWAPGLPAHPMIETRTVQGGVPPHCDAGWQPRAAA